MVETIGDEIYTLKIFQPFGMEGVAKGKPPKVEIYL
jgi:hypothetical protein